MLWSLLVIGSVLLLPGECGILEDWLGGGIDSSPSSQERLLQDASVIDSPETADHKIDRLLTAITGVFSDAMAAEESPRDNWYERYDVLAKGASNNSAILQELLVISKMAVPIIYSNYVSTMMWQRAEYMNNDGTTVVFVDTNVSGPRGHPLAQQRLDLAAAHDFVVETTMKFRKKGNFELCLMFEPEVGEEFVWEPQDILLGFHFKWHSSHATDVKEVVLNDKRDGVWSPGVRTPQNFNWPDFQVQERFEVDIVKVGDCFEVLVLRGFQMHFLVAPEGGPSYKHKFCPAAELLEDARSLLLIVSEDVDLGQHHVIDVYSVRAYRGLLPL